MNMGPLYRETLIRLGQGHAVEEILAANPTRRTFNVPESARVLLDELTLWGDPQQAQEALERWYTAGAQMPTVVLPPGRPLEELEHMLDAMCPLTSPAVCIGTDERRVTQVRSHRSGTGQRHERTSCLA